MPQLKDATAACFAWAQDANSKFCLQPTIYVAIYNHICVQKRLIDT